MIARVNHWITRLLDLVGSRSAPASDRERRSRSILRGTAAAFVARGIGSLTGIITVPLTVRYLGVERYGAWMTISGTLLLLNFTDFGLASSLTTALSKAFGEGNRESPRRYVSTTLFVLCCIATLLVIVGITCASSIARFLFPSVSPILLSGEIIPALVIALAIFALNFPLMITNRVLWAYQENATANLWIIASSVANLIGILVVIAFHGGLPMLVLGSAGVGLLVSAISTVWLYGWHKPWLAPGRLLADAEIVRELLSTGWKFFIGNVAWLINSQTDNLIIAHYLGPAQVTPYSVTFRLFAYASLLQSLSMQSVWPAYTEALTRKDFDWVQGIFRKNLKWGLLITIMIVTIFILFGQTIIRLWAGPSAVPPFSVILWMGIWNIILAYSFIAGTLLAAASHLTGLTVYSSATALLNIVLSILLVRRFGISGVIGATVIAYVIATLIPMTVETRTLLGGFRSSPSHHRPT